MSNDFDEDLKVALHDRARVVPLRPDLSGAAIRRAHGIRRRRRVAGAVAAAALVAVGVPVGLEVGDALTRGDSQLITPVGPDRDRSDTDRVVMSELTVEVEDLVAAGEPPQVPYLDGAELVVDGERIDLGGQGDIAAVAYAGDEAWFTVRDDEGNQTLRTTGDDTLAEPVGYGLETSPDGRFLAYVASGVLTVRDTATGEVSTLPVGRADHLSVATFVGDELWYAAGNGGRLHRWAIGAPDAEPVEGIRRATAVSPDGALVADMVEVTDTGTCTEVMEVGGPVLWETCEHRVLGFSPDGRFVHGAGAYGDGYADTYAVVLDARTGEVVMRVDGPQAMNRPQASFMQTVFETPTTLLLHLEQGDRATIARCDLTTGECARVTDMAEGIEPYAAASPYRLPG